MLKGQRKTFNKKQEIWFDFEDHDPKINKVDKIECQCMFITT